MFILQRLFHLLLQCKMSLNFFLLNLFLTILKSDFRTIRKILFIIVEKIFLRRKIISFCCSFNFSMLRSLLPLCLHLKSYYIIFTFSLFLLLIFQNLYWYHFQVHFGDFLYKTREIDEYILSIRCPWCSLKHCLDTITFTQYYVYLNKGSHQLISF